MYYSLTGELIPPLVADVINMVTHHINNGSKAPFTLYISTTGGRIEEALRLYGFLKAIPNSVEAVGYGQLDTFALLVFLAGDKRTALTHSQFELYEETFRICCPDEAPVRFHQATVNLFKAEEEKMLQLITQETNQKREQIEKLYYQGKTFSAEEARDFGIAHVVTDNFPLDIAPKPPEEPIKN